MEHKEMKRRHKNRNTELQLFTQKYHGNEYGHGSTNGKLKKKSRKTMVVANDQQNLDTVTEPYPVDETSHPRKNKRRKQKINSGEQPKKTRTEVNKISLKKKVKRRTIKGVSSLGKGAEETEVEGCMDEVMDSQKMKQSGYEAESTQIEPEVGMDGSGEYVTYDKFHGGSCTPKKNSLDGIGERKKKSKSSGSKRKLKDSKSESVKEEARDTKKTKKRHRLGMESIKSEAKVGIDEAEEITGVDEDYSKGMNKWLKEYWSSRPGLNELQKKIDEFIVAQEAHEEQVRKEQQTLAAEGGWTVVVRNKGKKKTTDSESGISVGSVAHAAVLDNVAKKKKEIPIDFYRFQKREAQRKEVMSLQSKFEQDKKRIQQIRAARKFRPY